MITEPGSPRSGRKDMTSLPGWRRCLAALMFSALLSTSAVAADAGFTAAMGAAERTAVGLSRLTEAEQDALDQQIARELRVARLGDVVAFAGTFTGRRPKSEWDAAGLAKLSETERAALDAAVARALAQRPITYPGRTQTPGAVATLEQPRGEWHGELSLVYGRGRGGREFYGGAVTTVYEDPSGWGAAVTLAQSRGDVFGYGYGLRPDCRYDRFAFRGDRARR